MVDLVDIIKDCLVNAYQLIQDLKNGEDVISEGSGFGSLVNDTEIKADKLIGERLVEIIKKHEEVSYITVEGQKEIVIRDDNGIWVTADPLDGSLNYALRGGGLGLPYSACVTVLKKRNNAVFNDIIAAGVIDLRNGDIWISKKIISNYRTFFNQQFVNTTKEARLDIGKMIVIGEMYYPENRDLLCEIFSGQKGWLRNPGSAAYEMALVASGTAVAYICDRQKQHELGAAFALVKGAGGVAVDFDGVDLGAVPYLFNAQTPVLLAANWEIAKNLFFKILSGKK